MRIFTILAFDGYYASSQTSHIRFAEVMGGVDMLHVGGYTTQVTGTSPTMQLYLEGSPDGTLWSLQKTLFSALALSTGAETVFQAQDDDPNTSVRFRYTRLGMALQGTDVRCFIQMWVTGRDRSRRSRGLRVPLLGQSLARKLNRSSPGA
jgi:hypothetical protein